MSQKWSFKKVNPICNYYKNNIFDFSNKKYNVIISNFSIHNIFKTKDGFYKFINQINDVTLRNSKIYISLIDTQEDIFLNDGSYIKSIKNELKYNDEINLVIQSWYKTYYSFRHIKPIKEPKINLVEFTKLMNKYGWKFNKEFICDKKFKIEGNWKKLMNSIKRIEFIKL